MPVSQQGAGGCIPITSHPANRHLVLPSWYWGAPNGPSAAGRGRLPPLLPLAALLPVQPSMGSWCSLLFLSSSGQQGLCVLRKSRGGLLSPRDDGGLSGNRVVCLGAEAAATLKPQQMVQGIGRLFPAWHLSTIYQDQEILLHQVQEGPGFPWGLHCHHLGSPLLVSGARGWVSLDVTPLFSWCLFQPRPSRCLRQMRSCACVRS